MWDSNVNRAVLLAGISLAVLGVATPTEANPYQYQWGAMRPPARIYLYEPPRRYEPSHRTVRPTEHRTSSPATRSRSERARTQRPLFDTQPRWSRPTPYRSYQPAPVYSTRPSRHYYHSDHDPVRSERSQRRVKEKPIVTSSTAKSEKVPHIVPSGQLHVIVSIDQQRASLYADGAFVASTKVSTGTKSHPTPMGVFSVIQKNRHHVSNLYGAQMPYMQRLTWSGTAMHTGPLPGYPASHGCIRLTNDFAQLLWKATRIGARVIVTREDVKPVAFTHDRLNFPDAPAAEPAVAASDASENFRAQVRMADATGSLLNTAMSASARSTATFEAVSRSIMVEAPASTPAATARKPGPVSIFVSRKDGKLYVRQAMQPLFDMPLTMRDPADPVGTHVFTAMGSQDGAMRWTAVSIPSALPPGSAKVEFATKGSKKKSNSETTGASLHRPIAVPDASAALNRIGLPQEALDRLAGLVTPGSSLIVSDNALSHETGRGTDFVVLTK